MQVARQLLEWKWVEPPAGRPRVERTPPPPPCAWSQRNAVVLDEGWRSSVAPRSVPPTTCGEASASLTQLRLCAAERRRLMPSADIDLPPGCSVSSAAEMSPMPPGVRRDQQQLCTEHQHGRWQRSPALNSAHWPQAQNRSAWPRNTERFCTTQPAEWRAPRQTGSVAMAVGHDAGWCRPPCRQPAPTTSPAARPCCQTGQWWAANRHAALEVQAQLGSISA